MSKQTQLANYHNYNVNRMIFEEEKKCPIPGVMKGLFYYRINLQSKNPDGTIGDFVVSTPPALLSFGYKDKTNPLTGEVTGHQMPFCLHSKPDDPTEDEAAFEKFIGKIVKHGQNYIIKNRKEIRGVSSKITLENNEELREKFNPIYRKRDDDGEIVEGKGPVLSATVIESRKHNPPKVLTQFWDSNHKLMDPMDIYNKLCRATAAIRIESIYMGSGKIRLQIKLYEVQINEIVNSVLPSLLPAPKQQKSILFGDENKDEVPEDVMLDDDDEEEVVDEDPIEDEDELVEETEEKLQVKPKKKRKVPRKSAE